VLLRVFSFDREKEAQLMTMNETKPCSHAFQYQYTRSFRLFLKKMRGVLSSHVWSSKTNRRDNHPHDRSTTMMREAAALSTIFLVSLGLWLFVLASLFVPAAVTTIKMSKIQQ